MVNSNVVKYPGSDDGHYEHGGEATTVAMAVLCRKIWEEKTWLKEGTQYLFIPLPKKGQLQVV
ncbi:hypothetical protein DPMN_143491 [Dreissena polymorpha]|uniref:Uncharacterized protein n=1 Tax=Dreissena polymorpha TaxID=45954 RepID=A0A9D4JPD3_DREPO|nr:hypothetical protein DPMN_143491 [Dreissena polymorpha]